MKRKYETNIDFYEDKILDIHKIFSIKKMIYLTYIINNYYKINEIFPNEIIIIIGYIMSQLKHKIPIHEKYYRMMIPFYTNLEEFNEIFNLINYGFLLKYNITFVTNGWSIDKQHTFNLTNKKNNSQSIEIIIEKWPDKHIIGIYERSGIAAYGYDRDYCIDETFYLFLLTFNKNIYYKKNNEFITIDISI
jgi:hypothetical protein